MFPKSKFYAIKVAKGMQNVIVKNWQENEKDYDYPSVYKSFKNEKDASATQII